MKDFTPVKKEPDGPYRNEAMSRDLAYDTAITFGLRYKGKYPCQPRPNGDGWDVVIPAEALMNLMFPEKTR